MAQKGDLRCGNNKEKEKLNSRGYDLNTLF